MLDIPLKDGDGYELIEARRSTLVYLPLVVVITGAAGSEAQSRTAGCDHHLTKPADPRELVNLLNRHAARLVKARPAEPAKASRLKVEI